MVALVFPMGSKDNPVYIYLSVSFAFTICKVYINFTENFQHSTSISIDALAYIFHVLWEDLSNLGPTLAYTPLLFLLPLAKS